MADFINKINNNTQIYFIDSPNKNIVEYNSFADFLLCFTTFRSFNKFMNNLLNYKCIKNNRFVNTNSENNINKLTNILNDSIKRHIESKNITLFKYLTNMFIVVLFLKKKNILKMNINNN